MQHKWFLFRFIFMLALVTSALMRNHAVTHAEPGTDKSGLINSSETWSLSNSPYMIVGSVRVQNNAVLTIQPGVVVKFKAGTALTIQQGTLIARGTATNPITFTADSTLPQPGHWGYILFNAESVDASFDTGGNYTGGSILQYATVEYAGKDDNGAVRMEDAAPFIDHNTIRRNMAVGVKGIRTTVRITNNTFNNNGSAQASYYYNYYAIDVSESAQILIDHNIIRQSPNGISVGGGINLSGGGSRITNNLIEESGGDYNNYGISSGLSGGYGLSYQIDGNVLRNNRFDNLITTYSGDFTVTNNRLYNNIVRSSGLYISGSNCVVSRNIIANLSIPSYYTPYQLNSISCNATSPISYNKIANNSHNGFTAGLSAPAGDIHHNNIVYNNAEKGKIGFDFSCGGSDNNFTYNTIYGQTGDGITANDNAGGIYVGDSCLPTNFAHNNIYGNQGVQLYNANRQSQPDLKVQQNWWGSAVENVIEDSIHHGIDDSSLGIVDYSNALTALDPDAPPPPPVGLAVSIQGSAVVLTWDTTQNRPNDIKGYRVYYDRDTGYPYEGTGATQGAAGFDVGDVGTATITGLPLGKTFYFAVTAYDHDPDPFIAESWYSREVVKRLPAPILLTVKPGSRSTALTWNPTNDPAVNHYRVSRAISGSLTFQGVAQNVADTNYDDTDATLIAGTAYCYQVEALDGDNKTVVTSNMACGIFGKLELWVPDTVGKSDSTVFVPINIQNADGLRIGASDIWLDFNSTIVESIGVSRTALTVDYNWAYGVQEIDANTSRVKISYIHNTPSSQPAELHGNGSLFWVNFRVKGADGASSSLDLREFVQGVGGSAIQNEGLSQLGLEVRDGFFTVKGAANAAFILGDIDGDGVVRAKDAALALQLAAGVRTPTVQEIRAGDINGNGVIQAADASMILYFAGNGKWPPLPGGGLVASAQTAATTLRLDNVLGRPGETVQTTLRATGLQKMAGGDFVIIYDGEVVSSISTVTKAGLVLEFDELKFQDDGLGRLYVEMADNAEINGDGVLAIIEMRLGNGAKIGKKAPLVLAEAKLNDLNGRDFVTSFASNTLNRQNGEITVSKLQAGPAAFNFVANVGEGAPMAQTLVITGDAATNWSVSASQPWISIYPASGTGSGSVSLQLDTSSLSVGTHNADLLIEAGAESVQRQVTLVLNPVGTQATLVVTPDGLNFSAIQGEGQLDEQILTITNSGSGALSWTASESIAWLSLDSTAGVAPAEVTVNVDCSGLTIGTYNGEIQVIAGVQSKSINVTLVVNEQGAQPQLILSSTAMTFNAKLGEQNPPNQSFTVSNSGTGALSWSASESLSWLSLSSTEGNAPATVAVSVNIDGLSVGEHKGEITVTTGAQSKQIEITVVVTASGVGEQKVFLPVVVR